MTVDRYDVHLTGSPLSFTALADAIGPTLPKRLEPGESETWMVNMEAVHQFVYAGQVISPGKRNVHMSVTLGTGKTVATKRAIHL